MVDFFRVSWKCFSVRPCNLPAMLLLDDDDELPELPDEPELDLAERLGSGGLAAIDASCSRARARSNTRLRASSRGHSMRAAIRLETTILPFTR